MESMRRRSLASKRRDHKNKVLGGLLILASIAIVSAASYFSLISDKNPLDKKTLCPLSGPTGQVILLVDKTDPLTFIQKEAFLSFLGEFGKSIVKEGELFSVFALDEDYQKNPEPIFEMCNPGQGDTKSVWTENPEKYKRDYNKKFIKPMNELADTLMTAKPGTTSPILEMLQLVSINGFKAHEVKGPKRLYVFSDMLINTPSYSHYHGNVDYDVFINSPLSSKFKLDLDKVSVEIRYLINSPTIQTRKHLLFWEKLFSDSGAHISAVNIVEG